MKASANRYVVALFGLALIAGCGKSNEGKSPSDLTDSGKAFPAMTFPETGTTDIHGISAGTYKATRVRSYSLGTLEDGKIHKGSFDHRFLNVGDPKKGDPVDRVTDWSGLNKSDKVALLTMDMNLPLRLEASGNKVEFKATYAYWQENRSNGSWEWHIEGQESSDGKEFHILFKDPASRQAGGVYGNDLMHGTAKVEGNKVLVYYETKVMKDAKIHSHQIVEVTYLKQ